MALDPRIALQGTQWQAPDFQGALAKGQEYRTNQMAQQAAQATAELNRNAMNDAALLDPNDRAAQQRYALRYGAAATPFLTALSGVDTNFAGRGTEARAQGEFETEQRDSFQGFMRTAIASIRNNPSDENIDAVSAQAEAMGIPPAQMAAYAGRFRAVPVEQRTALLDNELATTEDGRALLKTFTRDITMDDVGGSLVPRDTNLLAVGAVMPTAITKTPDPTPKTQLVPLADGTFAVVNLGTAQGTTATSPGGTPLVGRVPGAEGQITAQRRGQLQGQINTVNNDVIPALDRMDTLLATGDVITGAGAELRLQAARGLAFAGNQDARRQVAATQEYQNLAKSLAAGMAKTLGSNPSNADVALLTQVTGGMIGQETPALQATSAALRSRASGLVVDAQDMLGIEAAPAGGADMPPVGVRGATLTNSQTGATFVSDGTRWVPR